MLNDQLSCRVHHDQRIGCHDTLGLAGARIDPQTTNHHATPESLHAGTDEGVFRWNEHSARWEHLSKAPNDVWAVLHDPRDPSVLYSAAQRLEAFVMQFPRDDNGGACERHGNAQPVVISKASSLGSTKTIDYAGKISPPFSGLPFATKT